MTKKKEAMKRSVNQILLLFITAIACQSVTAQPAECIVLKSFPANSLTELIVSNKFGDVSLINTSGDSVIICATAWIDHRDNETGRKSLELIRMSVSAANNIISCKTEFDQKFFSTTLSSGRKSFNVSYIIKLPEYINSTIDNSFGSIKIEELSGRADLSISHGTLNAVSLARGNEKPVNRIVVRHSRATIGNAGWLAMELYHSPQTQIGNAQAISLVSEFSAITIGTTNSLVLNSSSDKYTIGRVTNCVAETKLSNIEISALSGIYRCDASLSTIRIDNLAPGFSEVNLSGNRTNIRLGITSATPYRLAAIARGAAAIITPTGDETNMKKESTVPGVYIVSGTGGGNPNAKSVINADLNGGKLEIFHNNR